MLPAFLAAVVADSRARRRAAALAAAGAAAYLVVVGARRHLQRLQAAATWPHATEPGRTVPVAHGVDVLATPHFDGRPLSRAHGDVYQVRAGGRPVLVLASAAVARGFYASQRKHERSPSFAVLGMVCSKLLGDAVGTQTGADWVRHRRPFKAPCGRPAAFGRDALYRARARALVQRVRACPGPFRADGIGLHRFTLDILADVVYGAELAKRHRAEIHQLAELHDALLPHMGSWHARVPGYRFLPTALNRDLRRFCSWWRAFNDRMWAAAVPSRARGASVLAVLRALQRDGALGLSRAEVFANFEEILLFNIDVMLSATGALLHNLATADGGAWQGRLRADVAAWRASSSGDEQGGSLPDELPLVDMFVKESARTCPSLALSLPEITHEELTIGGYRVPKGTVVVVDAFSINHDGRAVARPREFDPLRFRDRRLERVVHRFGLGARRCMGENFARAILARLVVELVSAVELRLHDPRQTTIGVKGQGLAFFTPYLSFPPLVAEPVGVADKEA